MRFRSTFSRFDFLWKLDLAAEYAAFVRTQPSVDAFEAELKKYMALEGEIGALTPTHTVGALRLHTSPLRASLKAEAGAWKTAFAKNLHSQALEDLRGARAAAAATCGRAAAAAAAPAAVAPLLGPLLTHHPPRPTAPPPAAAMHDYMRDASLKMGRPIEDLEDVRGVMDLQRELRDREAEIDTLMTPIEEIYALLTRYEVRVAREETDLLADLRPNWRKVRLAHWQGCGGGSLCVPGSLTRFRRCTSSVARCPTRWARSRRASRWPSCRRSRRSWLTQPPSGRIGRAAGPWWRASSPPTRRTD